MNSEHISFIPCLIDGKGLEPHQIKVELSRAGEFDRVCDEKFEHFIEETWKEKLQLNPKLFNGLKYRLHSFCLKTGGTGIETLNLQIGLTCYKDFMGTNLSPHVKIFQELGTKNFGNSQSYLSDAFAVGVLLKTADNKFVLIQRSYHVSEAQGLLDGPGGHAEPENTPGFSPEVGLGSVTGANVVQELFNSIKDEIVDEANIPKANLINNVLLGFTKNKLTAGRMAAEFLIECDLTSDEIISRYTAGGHKEADESTAMYCWREQEILDSINIPEKIVKMAPALIGRIQLYKVYKNLP